MSGFIGGGGGSTSPGGADTNVQYNDGGAFGGEAAFTYDKATDTMTAVNVAATITTATQASITTCANLTTVGTIATGVWNGTAIEGSAIASTGEVGGTKFLREDGDGTCSWQAVSASPGGADTQIQFNDGGVLNGEAAFTYNKTLDSIDLASVVTNTAAAKITCDSLTTGQGLWIYSNSASANGDLLFLENDGAGTKTLLKGQQDANQNGIELACAGMAQKSAISITLGAITSGFGINITNTGSSIAGGNMVYAKESTNTAAADRSGATLYLEADREMSAAATRNDDYDIGFLKRTAESDGASSTMNSSGSILSLQSVSLETQGTLNADFVGLEIIHQVHNDAADVYAINITCDNTGTSGPGGIDMSSFTAAEPLFNVPVDTTAMGARYGRVAVNVTGVGVKYLDLFEAS